MLAIKLMSEYMRMMMQINAGGRRSSQHCSQCARVFVNGYSWI